MAGGVGSRFWPVSTSKNPKQFRDLLGSGETLIQTTFNRLSKIVPSENIYILTNEIYEELVHEQLPMLHGQQVVLEPAMRNTAPAVLLAALKIYKKNKDAVMLMAPSDHWIQNEDAFLSDVQTAFESCRERDRIVTLGIRPTFPNTGFGYIKFEQGPEKVLPVHNFTEKPGFEKAQEFIQQGNYVWNAGIFIWNVRYILNSFEDNLPQMYEQLHSGLPELNTISEQDFVRKHYPLLEDISIDYGILEKEENIFVILAAFDWNDLGTWGAIYDETDKDANQNSVLNTRLLADKASGNIISTKNNKVVVVEGINDYIIIDEDEVLLLVPKDRDQEIKAIRAKVQQTFGDELG